MIDWKYQWEASFLKMMSDDFTLVGKITLLPFLYVLCVCLIVLVFPMLLIILPVDKYIGGPVSKVFASIGRIFFKEKK